MGGWMIKRQYYGWLDLRRRKLMLSFEPPDALVRPAKILDSLHAVQMFAEKNRGRVNIMWSPPLPVDVDRILATK
jgi:hypothetical protein